jgi:hypothetical protein
MSRNTKIKSLNDGIKIDMVSGSQMSPGEREAVFNREPNIDGIPDLDTFTGHVLDILTYLEKSETRELMKTNDSAIRMYLNNKYADCKIPFGIITVLMEEDQREENVERLLKLIKLMRDAKSGKISLEDAEKNLTEDVNNRYLYSKYGGSKESFEQALHDEIKKEQKKKNSSNAVELKNIGKVKIKN